MIFFLGQTFEKNLFIPDKEPIDQRNDSVQVQIGNQMNLVIVLLGGDLSLLFSKKIVELRDSSLILL